MGTLKFAHELDGSDILPMNASPKLIMAHEAEAEESAPLTPEESALKAKSILGRGATGLARRAEDVGLALKQKAGMAANLPIDAANWAAALMGLSGRPSANDVRGGAPATPEYFARSSWPKEVEQEVRATGAQRKAVAGDPYATVGGMVPDVALSMLARKPGVLQGIMTGAGIEGLTRPQQEATWGNTATDAGSGALYGGLGSIAANTLLSGAGKTINAARGQFKDPEYARRLKLFQDQAIPGSLGDITQHPTIMRAEDLSKIIPGSGRNEFLANQAAALKGMADELPERIAGSVPSATKEDIGQALAKSLKAKYKQAKGDVGDMYSAVEQGAVGKPAVQATGLATEAKALLSKYPSAFAKISDDPQTVGVLQSIAKGTAPGQSVILGANGLPIATPPNLSFAELRVLDSDLGALIRQGRRLNARGEMNDKAFGQLVKVQSALRQDMDNWSTSIGAPDIAKGVSEANKAFRDQVMPFRQNSTVRRVLQDENFDTDTLANLLFKLDAPTRTAQSVSFLTPEGVQAGRFHLINEAKNRARSDVLESGYSPSKLLSHTQLGESGPKMYSPSELEALAQARELVKLSGRAGAYTADPQNGSRMAGIAAMMNPKLSGMSRLFSTMSQSPKVMSFSLADPRITGTAPRAGLGALGQYAETGLRKAGTGLGVSLDQTLPLRDTGNNSWSN